MHHCFLFAGMLPCGPVRVTYHQLEQTSVQQRPVSCADLEEEQRNDVVHTMFKRVVTPGEVLIRQGPSCVSAAVSFISQVVSQVNSAPLASWPAVTVAVYCNGEAQVNGCTVIAVTCTARRM